MATGPVVGVYTIGQTPRPDLTDNLGRRFSGVEFRVTGALDGLTEDDLPSCSGTGYPLETRFRSGARVVVDAEILLPRVQHLVSRWDEDVDAHFILCAGPFQGLTSEAPLVHPFEEGVAEMERRGFTSLEVAVPFRDQALAALRKWKAAGFEGRAHALADIPERESLSEWLGKRLAGTDADALVFDYVGFPGDLIDSISAQLEIPAFDLGDLAMDALENLLNHR